MPWVFGISNLNVPSAPVEVPSVVPFTITVTPGRGLPLESTTLPCTTLACSAVFCCAGAFFSRMVFSVIS